MPQPESRKTRRPYPIRLAPEELAQIRLQADVAGVPIGTYIRHRALGRRLPAAVNPRQLYRLRQQQIAALQRLGAELVRLLVESGEEHGPMDRAAVAAALAEIRLAAHRIERSPA